MNLKIKYYRRYWHFESERYTQNYIVDSLKKITNFAIVLSQENTNPVKYLLNHATTKRIVEEKN
jgi:hypothetical protein